MLVDEEQEGRALGHSKTLALASGCAWLQLILEQQDHILALADALAGCCNTRTWTREVTHLQESVDRYFQVEELVTGAGIESLGLRANAVLADASRRRIQHHLETLRLLSWREGRELVERARWELESHFLDEGSRSYRPLARTLFDAANDALTRQCGEIAGRAVQ